MEQLQRIHDDRSALSSPAEAGRLVNGILDYCAGLDVGPERGTRRDDLAPGLWLIGRRDLTIAFVVEGDDVIVSGIAYEADI